MKTTKAVIFDFIGTLATVKDYSYSNSEKKLYDCLQNVGLITDYKSFADAYRAAHEKYRAIRLQQLVEVTNAVWVSEALNQLNYKTTPRDEKICAAINMFFEDYIQSLRPRRNSKKVLQKLKPHFALGLVSNFTYAPVIHAGLRKLEMTEYFNGIVVSQDFGWRKPCLNVFQEILRRLKVDGEEAVYVGDSPEEDIKGAHEAGMQTIFIPSQFYSVADLEKAAAHPDLRIDGLTEILVFLMPWKKMERGLFFNRCDEFVYWYCGHAFYLNRAA
jgi:putative hydrolase of the HAD superfamily